MIKKSIPRVLFLFSVLSLNFAASALPLFDSAVAHYKAGQYRQAATEFKQVAASYPNNALSHYYLALCYQSLGNRAEARQEFSLTSQYGDASLKAYAQRALSTLSATGQNPGTSALSAGQPDNRNAGSIDRRQMGQAALAMAGSTGNGAAAPGQTASGQAAPAQVAEVLEFYTDWCHVCKEFEPVWSETQRRVNGVQFHSYNAEDGSNSVLVQKYNVHAYPTLVYLDRSGKVLKNMAGAYNTSADFANSIRFLR
jgi:thiol-disulfide isomerase/thioredoxin